MPGESRQLNPDPKKPYICLPLTVDAAKAHLETLVALYRQGSRAPVPLILNASAAYAKHFAKNEDAEAALAAARKAWESDDHHKGDGEDPWIAMAFRDSDPLDARFAKVSLMVWGPMLG